MTGRARRAGRARRERLVLVVLALLPVVGLAIGWPRGAREPPDTGR